MADPTYDLDDVTFQGDARVQSRIYYWNESGEPNNGFQIVTPLTLGASLASDVLLLEFDARTAFIHAQRSGPTSGSVSSLSDTVLSTTATFSHESLPFFPFLSASVNVPTGNETLRGSQKNAVVDQDLVEQTRFGEGLNLNLGGGVTIPIDDSFSTTIGGSFNARGSYVPDGDTGFVFNPGNQLVSYAEILYQDPRTLASLGLKYNSEEASALAGIPFFQPGDSFEVYGRVGRAITNRDYVNGSFSFARFTKNERFDPFTGTFRTDDARSAGNVYRVSLEWRRKMSFGSLGLAGEVLIRDKNDFDELSDRFLPSRQRYLIGPTASIILSEKSALNLHRHYMHLSEGAFPVTGVQRSFNGVFAGATVDVNY